MRFLLVILLSLISFMQPQAQNCSNSVFNGGDLCQCETIKYTDPADSSNNVVIGDMQEVCKDSGYTKCIGKVDFGYPVAEYCFCPDPTEKEFTSMQPHSLKIIISSAKRQPVLMAQRFTRERAAPVLTGSPRT